MKATNKKSSTKLFDLKRMDTDFPKITIKQSSDSYYFIKDFYSDDLNIYESFFILLLNNSNKTIGYAKISQGGIVGTLVDVRIVAKYCLDSLSTACILAHNHPSGKLTPSMADKDITQKIVKALNLFDIKVLDHIILTEDGYYSFADNCEDSLNK